MSKPESVAGAIFSADRKSVLLIHRRDVPVWVLPGGGIDPGESPEAAVVREVFEETGFRVKVVRLAGIYLPINRLARHMHLYECEIVDGDASVTEETRDVRFFFMNALPMQRIPPPYPEWIADAHRVGPTVEKLLTNMKYRVYLKYLILHPILILRFFLSRMGWAINTK